MNAFEHESISLPDHAFGALCRRNGIDVADASLIDAPPDFIKTYVRELHGTATACVTDVTHRLAFPGTSAYGAMVEQRVFQFFGRGDVSVLPYSMLAHVALPERYPYPRVPHVPEKVAVATEMMKERILMHAEEYFVPLPGEGPEVYEVGHVLDTVHVRAFVASEPDVPLERIRYNGGFVWALELRRNIFSKDGMGNKAYVGVLGKENDALTTLWVQSGAAIPEILRALEARQRDVVAAVDTFMHGIWEQKVARGLTYHVCQLLAQEVARRGPFGFILAAPPKGENGFGRWVGMQVDMENNYVRVLGHLPDRLPITFFNYIDNNYLLFEQCAWVPPQGVNVADMPSETLKEIQESIGDVWKRFIPPIAQGYGTEKQEYRALLATRSWDEYLVVLNRAHGYSHEVLFSS